MKKCTRFHFEDVEPGDRLLIGDAFEITVERTVATQRFGPVVAATDGVNYYLDDYDVVKQVET